MSGCAAQCVCMSTRCGAITTSVWSIRQAHPIHARLLEALPINGTCHEKAVVGVWDECDAKDVG